MFNVFVVYTESDLTEGRGPMRLVAVFNNLDAAEVCKSTQPTIMGRMPKGIDSEIKEIKVFESILDYNKFTDSELKRSALAKLTNDEKRALGY